MEDKTERVVFERCSVACNYDFVRSGVYPIEYSQDNLTTLLKLANQLGIEWLVVTDVDTQGAKHEKYARAQLEGRNENTHICRLGYGDMEMLFCMGKDSSPQAWIFAIKIV